MPLQGDKLAPMITQGAALGYELLPFQGVWDKTCETSVKSPLEKVIFDNFFKCNHLIIKWHFVEERTKNYFLKWTQLVINLCSKL